ncbi:MAG: hydroxymethylbilane synthase [Pseudomonadota bacterium]
MDTLRIATRESQLALWQARHVAAVLSAAHIDLEVELVPMTTRGDQWLSAPLSEVGGKGLFIKELEIAMLEGRADLAVHSMKDVPAVMPDGFELAAIGHRADARDALVGAGVTDLDSLPQGARVGSSSLRRQAQLRRLRADLEILPVRGNVNTRLAKLDAGEFDALILAAAGLDRLGFSERIAGHLSLAESLPAAGQGALGIECRAGDGDVLKRLAVFDEPAVSTCVRAERLVSEALEASCSTPLAAYCVQDSDGAYRLEARLASVDGVRMITASGHGPDWSSVGREVAEELLSQGAQALLDELEALSG